MAKEEYELFDWVGAKDIPKFEREFISGFKSDYMNKNETDYQRKLRMLKTLGTSCDSCTMCDFGRRDAVKGDTSRDPHVFSNNNPNRFMLVGIHPDWDDVCDRVPGINGNLWDLIEVNKVSIDDFYVTNVLKCYVNNEDIPKTSISRCSSFLKMEIDLIRPLLVVAIGETVFNHLCPDHKYKNALGLVVKSRFGPDVFTISDPTKGTKELEEQVKLLCWIIKKLKVKHKI